MLEKIVGIYPPIHKVRADAKEYGLPEALRLHLSRNGINLKTYIPEVTQEVLNTGAVLEISHHTGLHTGIISWFSTLPNREDMLIIGDGAMFKLWLGDSDLNNVIDVKGVAKQPAATLASKLIRKFRLLTTDRENPSLRNQVMINRQNISEAITHINLGNLVVYAPDGGCDPKLPWSRRTGEIINGVDPRADAFLVMVYIKNLSNWANSTFLYQKSHAQKLAENDEVYLSEPIAIADIRKRISFTDNPNVNNRAITNMLQRAHIDWQLTPQKPFSSFL